MAGTRILGRGAGELRRRGGSALWIRGTPTQERMLASTGRDHDAAARIGRRLSSALAMGRPREQFGGMDGASLLQQHTVRRIGWKGTCDAGFGQRRDGRRDFRAVGPASMADLDDFHTFETSNTLGATWMDYRSQAAKKIGVEEHKTWPLYEVIKASGPGNANTALKVHHCLTQIERMLDVFEPGQIALAYNGGKDSTCLLELVRAACSKHPTHKFSHVQPVWFQTPGQEFPELVEFVKEVVRTEMTDTRGIWTDQDQDLCRLWCIYVGNQEDYHHAMTQLTQTTGIRCVIMGSRRSDPGCRDLSEIALLELGTVMRTHAMTRLKLETQLNKMRVEGAGYESGSNGKEPSLIRFSPLLEWSYRDVWDFILAAKVNYCPLYDQGYSSIGTVVDTVRNYALLKRNIDARFAKPASYTPPPPLAHDPTNLARLERARLSLYQSVGVGAYATESSGGDWNSGRLYNVSDDYYPAWYLQDESKESASRIREYSADNAFISIQDQNLKDSAAVLIVGNEILAGRHKHEEDAQFLCEEIRKLGYEVKQVMAVENDIDVIAFMVRRLAPIHKHLYIIGGVGTAHHHHTVAAVAKACGVGVQKDSRLLDLVLATVIPDHLTEFHIKMADIPFGANVIGEVPGVGHGWAGALLDWPIIIKNNIVVLNTSSLRTRFSTLAPIHGSGPIFVSRITVFCDDGILAPKVHTVDMLFPSVSVHMFPDDESDSRSVVWIQGKNFEQQQATVDAFLDMIDEDQVYDVYEEHTEGATAQNIGNNQPQRDSGADNFAIS